MSRLTGILLTCIILCTYAEAQQGVNYLDNWMRPNGSVYTILKSGNTIYLGGTFSALQYNKRNGASLNTTTGMPDLSVVAPNGTVNAVTPDGTGGWIIGGDFTQVAGQNRNYLARINANGSLHPWNPNPNSSVMALVCAGSRVYVGGNFTTIGTKSRNYLAVVDMGADTATNWNVSPNGTVSALTLYGSTIYAGGDFSAAGGVTVQGLAALDTAGTGAVKGRAPLVNGIVNTLTGSGSTMYVGGNFNSASYAETYGAALSTTTGLPNLDYLNPNGSVSAVAPDGAGGWYIGGSFTSVGGQARNFIARINANGSLHPWNPNANGTVNALAISGSTVYVGGGFTTIGGQSRKYIAALDAATGNAASWNPDANNQVLSFAISGSTLYAGGYFTTIGGQTRSYIAALDATTGIATTWNPNANNTVSALAISGSTVYAGGWFTTIGGQTRSYIAALDAATGNAASWNPNANSTVRALAISGSTVYVGGGFTTIGGQSRNYIAALDAATGNAASWNPNANYVVGALAISGSTVYAGGDFTRLGGIQTRNNLMAFDTASAAISAWNPNASNYVTSLAISGSTVYAGGWFTTIGGQTRSYMAALDATTGNATTWNPNANNTVSTLVISGTTVYAGGSFSTIGGQVRSGVAAIDATTGNATSWSSNTGSVNCLALNGTNLYVGGNFSGVFQQPRSNVAALNATTGQAIAWNPNANGTVSALAISGSTVYAGGLFTTIGGQTRSYIAALDAATGNATTWNPNANSTVSALAISGSTLYAGGYFTTIGGQSRNYIAALDATTGNAATWNPNANSTVSALAISGSTVYAGGNFTTIGGQTRSYLAALDATAGNATTWRQNANNAVGSMAIRGNTIYVGGSFTSIGGNQRSGAAAFDLATGAINAWNPPLPNGWCGTAVTPSTTKLVYVGSCGFVRATDSVTGVTTTWNPAPSWSGSVYSLATSGDTIYIGGDFFSMGGDDTRSSFVAVTDAAPSVIISGTGTNVCYGISNTFAATVLKAGSTPTYQWQRNSVNISGATLATFTSNYLQHSDTLTCRVTASSPGNLVGLSNPLVMNGLNCNGGLTLNDSIMRPNGPVYGSTIVGNNIYLGGNFDRVDLSSANAALISADSALPAIRIASPNGSVFAAVADGFGGWYIGGQFTTVGGLARNNIARLRSDGTVHPWNPNVNGTTVRCMTLSGANLYFGGNFWNVGSTTRSNLAAVDTSTGNLTTWNPGANGQVNAMVVSGTRVYLGGSFTTVANTSRLRLAAVSISNGAINTWNPSADNTVNTLALSGGVVYAGGTFSNVGGQSRTRLVQIDGTTGAVMGLSTAVTGTSVNALQISANTLFVGGEYTILGGASRANLGAINVVSGTVSNWNPAPNGTISGLAVAGNQIYTAGTFSSIGNANRNRFASLDTILGNAGMWAPQSDANSTNNFLTVAGNRVFVAGSFTRIGVLRNRLTAININTGLVTSWNPDANAVVKALSVQGSRVYLGGNFTTINGMVRNRIAAVDLTTGSLASWNPGSNGNVEAITFSGNQVYVGGSFSNIGGAARSNIAAIDTATGVATSWNPNADGDILTLAAGAGIIYAGGAFGTIGGATRNSLAAIDLSSGAATSWNPAPDNDVYALALSGNKLYVGGLFTNMGNVPRNYIAALQASGNGNVLNWNPIADNVVQTLRMGATVVYAGGAFTKIGNQNKSRIAAIDTGTAIPNYWTPNFDNNVWSISLLNNRIFVGGQHTSVNSNSNQRFFSPLADSSQIIPLSVVISATSTTICSGALDTFTAYATSAGSVPQYQWYRNGVLQTGATSATWITANLSNNDVITCLVTSSEPGNPTVQSSPVVLTVNNCTPAVIINGISPQNNLCQGGTVNLAYTALSMNAGNVLTAQLSNSSGAFTTPVTIGTITSSVSGVIQATIPTNQASGTGYRIRIVSSTPAITSENNGTNLIINARPTTAQAKVTASGSLNVCPGNAVTLSVPRSTGFTYQWRLGGTPINGATDTSYAASSAGVYSVMVTNTNGCSLNSSNSTVALASVPSATISPNTPLTYSGSPIVLSANSGTGLTYQWLMNGIPITGATNIQYSVTNGGAFTVAVTNTSGCSKVSDPVIVTAPSVVVSGNGTVTRCAGDTITISYTTSGMNVGNVFTMQLSDAKGSFTSAQNIGVLTATSSGTMTGTIPTGSSAGNGYKLRINSSNPATTGAASGLTLQVRTSITDSVRLCAVTVDSATGRNRLVWNKPITSNIDTFVVYRISTASGQFVRLGSQINAGVLSVYLDTGANPSVRSWRYYISGKNVCSETVNQGSHETIHLTINAGQNANTWNLIWNGYEGLPHATYTVWRGTSVSNMAPLAFLPAKAFNSYTDFNAPSGTVFYQVRIADGPSCNPTARTTSGGMWVSSNVATNAKETPLADWADMSVYPNPSQYGSKILIQSSNTDDQYKVRVLDVSGRVVLMETVESGKPKSFGTQLVPGIYIIEAVSNSRKMVQKWIKQ